MDICRLLACTGLFIKAIWYLLAAPRSGGCETRRLQMQHLAGLLRWHDGCHWWWGVSSYGVGHRLCVCVSLSLCRVHSLDIRLFSDLSHPAANTEQPGTRGCCLVARRQIISSSRERGTPERQSLYPLRAPRPGASKWSVPHPPLPTKGRRPTRNPNMCI